MTVSAERFMACLVAVALALAPACAGDRGAGDEAAEGAAAAAGPSGMGAEVTTEYAPELRVELATMTKLPSGLYMKDLQVGEGELAMNERLIRVHYTGWLPSGVEFDSSRDGDPLTFTVGSGDVIAGWDEGVTGMRPGGRRLLVIPPSLAYGERGYPGLIPGNSTLVFDVQLVEVVQ